MRVTAFDYVRVGNEVLRATDCLWLVNGEPPSGFCIAANPELGIAWCYRTTTIEGQKVLMVNQKGNPILYVERGIVQFMKKPPSSLTIPKPTPILLKGAKRCCSRFAPPACRR